MAYAAFGKWADFEAFQVQIGQSVLLHDYASFLPFTLLGVELLVAVALCVPKTRLVALYSSIGILSGFTVYIYIVLYHTQMSTCSCSGIFEKMSFETHMGFNAAFVVLGTLGVWLHDPNRNRVAWRALAAILLGSGLVWLLFVTSKHRAVSTQNFERNFLTDSLRVDKVLDLQAPYFYMAGYVEDTVFVANSELPLLLAQTQGDMDSLQWTAFELDEPDWKFATPRTYVQGPDVYLTDGRQKAVFQAERKHPKAVPFMLGKTYFNTGIPIDSSRMVMLGLNGALKQYQMGLMHKASTGDTIIIKPDLIEKQVDGIFDSTGQLNYSPHTQKVVFTYNYRNEYIVTHADLTLEHRGQTIDRTAVVQLSSMELKDGGFKKTSPTDVVNSHGVVHRNLLFNISSVMGQTDAHKTWRQVVVVDVYDYELNQYKGSFYVNNQSGVKPSQILVTDQHFYALFGSALIRFGLPESVRNNMNY